MVYTISELQDIITPIARKYGLRAVYLFGSYARREATEGSDIDLIVDCGAIRSAFQMGGLYADLSEGFGKSLDLVTTDHRDKEEALGKPIDLLTVSSFSQKAQMPSETAFRETVQEERKVLYAVA